MGIKVVSILTGDCRVGDVMQLSYAALNVLQCSRSMTPFAQKIWHPLYTSFLFWY